MTMGFFRTKSVEQKLPKRKVEDWKKSDVGKWLDVMQMKKYEDAFKTVSGKRLLQLSAADIYRFAENKQDADLLLEAIQSLRETGTVAQRLVAEDSANNYLPSQSSSASGVTDSPASTPSAEQAELAQGPFLRVSVPASTAELEPQPPAVAESYSEPPAVPTPQSTHDAEENAKILSSWTGGIQAVSQLFSYLNQLHIVGAGLVDATESCPVVGHIVGAIWELHESAAKAQGQRANCLLLDNFMQDVMRTLDNQGRSLQSSDPLQLANMLELVEAAIDMVDTCNKPGWLLRMAGPNKFLEDLTSIHGAMLELSRAMKIDTLPNGRQLTYGAYKDCSRPLRRCLKQVGSGSIEGGIAAIKADSKALEEVSALLAVDNQILLREAESSGPLTEVESRSTASDSDPLSPQADSGNASHQAIFEAYDKNHSGALEFEELHAVLADLGILDGIKQTEVDAFVAQQLRQADSGGHGCVTYKDFCEYYQAMSLPKARLELRKEMGMEAERMLRKVFISFASFAVRTPTEDLDGAKFSKLCKDAKLLGRNLSTIEVDIVFAKVKVKGQRKITFDQFVNALGIIAEKKGQPLKDTVQLVLQAGGPSVSGTKAGFVKFHDDKSTYTGVHARGGPSCVEPSNDLSALLDRSPADIRGVKYGGSPGASSLSPGAQSPLSGSMTARGTPPSGSMTARGTPRGLRSEPSAFGYGNTTPSGSSTSRATTPKFSTTTSRPTSATKSATQSRPSTASRSSTSRLGRSSVAGATASSENDASQSRMPSGSMTARGATPTQGGMSTRPASGSMTARGAPSSQDGAAMPSGNPLVGPFQAFTAFGTGSSNQTPPAKTGMDGASFAKLCRETGLLGGKLNSTSVDLAFTKAKAKGSRRMSFKEFENALELVAASKGVDREEVRQKVAASPGPACNAIQASAVRLHDDKSTYTGVYAQGGPSVVEKRITMESLTDRTNSLSRNKRMTA